MSNREFEGAYLTIEPVGYGFYYGYIRIINGPEIASATARSWQRVYDVLGKALCEYYKEGGDVQNGNAKDGQEKG